MNSRRRMGSIPGGLRGSNLSVEMLPQSRAQVWNGRFGWQSEFAQLEAGKSSQVSTRMGKAIHKSLRDRI